VDLNRNFAASNFLAGGPGGRKPLSEPESKAIARAIETYRPGTIISIHAPLRCVDPDGGEQSEPLARQLASLGGLSYRDLPEMPGSLGSWAGRDLGLVMVTYELGPAKRLDSRALERHVRALAAAIDAP
jgi:protein MpaA